MTASLTAEQVELIARVIHERYRANHDPSAPPWERLPESLKHSNRAQAAAIPEKASSIGCRIAPLNGPPASLSPAELERLARNEHERWVRERREAGWTAAPVKDVARKQTPYLVGWEELSEEVRELDRDAVRGMAEALDAAGLGLYRS
jgi:hypothetical protein